MSYLGAVTVLTAEQTAAKAAAKAAAVISLQAKAAANAAADRAGNLATGTTFARSVGLSLEEFNQSQSGGSSLGGLPLPAVIGIAAVLALIVAKKMGKI